MKKMKVVKCASMDENFYTLPKHVPDRDLAVQRCVTSGLIDIIQNICRKLEVDFETVGWSILESKQLPGLKAEFMDLLSDELFKQGIK